MIGYKVGATQEQRWSSSFTILLSYSNDDVLNNDILSTSDVSFRLTSDS